MLGDFTPKTGSLLISEPFMLDPNFKRSVILLVDYTPNGETFGLVLNQVSQLVMHEILYNDLPDLKSPVYLGGPVEEASFHFIHRIPEKIKGGHLIKRDLYYGGDFQTVLELFRNDEIAEHDIKFFLGYAGWSPTQLESEIQNNTWFVLNEYHTEIPMLQDTEDLWKECIIAMGPKFAHVAEFPQDPSLN